MRYTKKREIKKISKFQETLENTFNFTTKSKVAYESRRNQGNIRQMQLGIK